jgi:excisionase family DNA binding protein
MPQDFFTIADVAAKLQLHAKTVLNFVHEGQLKAMRIGKQYRIAPSDLRAFMRGATPSFPGEVQHARYIEASAVLNIDLVDAGRALRVAALMQNACDAQLGGDEHVRVDCIHNAETARLKIIVSGRVETAAYLIGLVPAFLRA